MLEKFGDNRSLVTNVCPCFYTSSKTSIGFYARKCIQEFSSVGESRGGGAQLFRWDVGIVQLLLLSFSRRGTTVWSPCPPPPLPPLNRCMSMFAYNWNTEVDVSNCLISLLLAANTDQVDILAFGIYNRWIKAERQIKVNALFTYFSTFLANFTQVSIHRERMSHSYSHRP